MNKVSEALQKARARNNMSYRQFAAWLGVSLSQAYEWETGRSEPTLRNVRRLAQVLGRKVSSLVT